MEEEQPKVTMSCRAHVEKGNQLVKSSLIIFIDPFLFLMKIFSRTLFLQGSLLVFRS